jgi:hypothetical protein
MTDLQKSAPDLLQELISLRRAKVAKPVPTASIDGMLNFVVLYSDKSMSMFPADAPFGFQCWANNVDHAEEQCENAYPDGDIVWVWQGNNGVGIAPALTDYYSVNGVAV